MTGECDYIAVTIEQWAILIATSAEAAIALRQRLNETVDQLDVLRKKHAELELQFETQSKDLTIVTSDREFRRSHLSAQY